VSPVPVQATLIGLEPDTTYYYRLQATNGNGTNPGESFQDHVLRLPAPA
jgi:phosphodiesterase/alkaline phosphatase D-like protein